jgi:N-acetylglucosaminyl-diphospho-decaprenol L-rhamnosyltransferase
VTIVENHSGDEVEIAQAIIDHGWDHWAELRLADRNGGFAYGNNLAIRPTLSSENPPRYIILLNSDTEVRPGAIHTLVQFMDTNPRAGLAGSSFENLDGSLWPIAFRFFTPLSELESGLRLGLATKLLKHHVVARVMPQDRPQQVDWVSGACMIIRHHILSSTGLLDEAYFLYYEEVDFCLRALRKGWPCWYVPESRVMHIAGQSSELTQRDKRPPRLPPYWFASRRRYFLKNYGIAVAIAADLAFGLGLAFWRVRRFLFRKPDRDPPHLLKDFWLNSLLFRRF